MENNTNNTANNYRMYTPDHVKKHLPVKSAKSNQKSMMYHSEIEMRMSGHRPVKTFYRVMKGKGDMTESGTAYLMRCAEKMAYTAVKSAYVASKTANPHLLDLMNESVIVWKDNNRKEFNHNISFNEMPEFEEKTEFIPVKSEETIIIHGVKKHYEKKTFIPVKVPVFRTSTHAMQEIAVRKERRGKIVVQRESVELSEIGKEIMRNPVPVDCDFRDCVSVATLALLEMADAGILTDYESVWANRSTVYSAVNRYVHAHRKSRTECEMRNDYTFRYDEKTDTDRIESRGKAEKRIEMTDISNLLEYIEIWVRDTANRKANTEKWIECVRLLAIGYSKTEIAKEMGISEGMVRKYCRKVAECVKNDQYFYEIIHSFTA